MINSLIKFYCLINRESSSNREKGFRVFQLVGTNETNENKRTSTCYTMGQGQVVAQLASRCSCYILSGDVEKHWASLQIRFNYRNEEKSTIKIDFAILIDGRDSRASDSMGIAVAIIAFWNVKEMKFFSFSLLVRMFNDIFPIFP